MTLSDQTIRHGLYLRVRLLAAAHSLYTLPHYAYIRKGL